MIWKILFYTEPATVLAGIPGLFFHGAGWVMLPGASGSLIVHVFRCRHCGRCRLDFDAD